MQLPRAITDRIRPNPYAAPPVTTVEEHRGGLDAAEIERRQRDNIVVKGVGLIGGLLQTLEAHGGRALTDARAERLLTTNGAVTGVRAAGQDFAGPGDHRQRRV